MMDFSTEGDFSMKTISKRNASRSNKSKKPRATRKTFEDAHRRVFVGPSPNTPARERLSMYKSVPSVTTYGLCEKPT
jgi:hypothetical protein